VTATNKFLKPEKINSHTVLLEHAFSPVLHVTASGFSNHLSGVIEEEQDPTTGDTHFANEPGDSGRGGEVEAIGGSLSRWSARASYTLEYTRGSQGKRVMNSPQSLAKFNGTMPVRRIGFWGTELLYTTAQTNFLRERISPSFLINTSISTRTFWNSYQFSASCYNLLDRTWATPTGPEVVQPATVQDGRTWRFRLTYRPGNARKWPLK
jgi:hypothetical protein